MNLRPDTCLLIWMLWAALPPAASGQSVDAGWSSLLAERLVARGLLDAAVLEAGATDAGIDRALDEVALSFTPRGLRMESEEHRAWLRVSGRIQTRFSFVHAGGESSFGHSIERVSLRIEGALDDGSWRFRVQSSHTEDEIEGFGPITPMLSELKEGWLEWRSRSSGWRIRVGQFKTPGPRQRMTGQARLQLFDRSQATRTFGRPRNPGAQVAHHAETWTARLGAFNGSGENTDNVGDGLLYATRLSWHPQGEIRFSEPLLGADEPGRGEVAVYGFYDARPRDRDRRAVGVDAIWRTSSWSIQAEFGVRQDGEGRRRATRYGGLIQVGLVLEPETWELAVRGTVVRRGARAETEELVLALNRYLHENRHKLGWEVGRVVSDEDPDLWLARFQIQLSF